MIRSLNAKSQKQKNNSNRLRLSYLDVAKFSFFAHFFTKSDMYDKFVKNFS